MYFVIACFQLVFDFPCFGSCSERFQGKRFQGMRVLRKSSFCDFIFVLLIYFAFFLQPRLLATQAISLFWLKVVQHQLQENLHFL